MTDTTKESGLSKFFAGVKLATLLGLLFVGYNVAVGTGLLRSSASRSVAAQGIEQPAQLVPLARGVTLGDEGSRITITEFGDFQCPACRAFATNTKPQLEAAFVQTGQAKFVFLDFPLTGVHANSFLASRAARCAEDQGRFWEYHDELFRQQERWAEAALPAEAFVSYAELLQLDTASFGECLASDRHADVVAANAAVADALRLYSVPTILITVDGETRAASDRQGGTIARVIDEMTR